MDADARKAALRMIPCGLYVLTAKGAGGATLWMNKLREKVCCGG